MFPGSSHTSDLKNGTPVATLPGAWRYRVSTGSGRPGVSILWLDEVECLICNFCLSVAARKIVWADPSLRYTSLLLGRYSTNKQTIVNLVVKASTWRAADLGFESRFLRGDFSRSSHSSDLKIGTPVAALPGAWRYRVSTGTGRPVVSIIWLGEVELGSPTFISVWQHVQLSEQIRPWDTLACCWDVNQPTNQPTNQHTTRWPSG